MKKQEIINHLAQKNTYQYNLLKTCEELNELSEILLKKVNKFGGPKEPTDDAIIEEIGDVQLRLLVLFEVFDDSKIEERVQYKLKKYKEYIEEGKYTGGI